MVSPQDSGAPSKVERIIDEYGLDGMGEKLEAAWTGEDGTRTSLRDLAEEFNKSVLEATVREAGSVATEYDIDTTYHVLTDDDVPSSDRLRKERELDQDGVHVDQMLKDFVTHQAIHTYLTKYRGVELTDQSIDPDAKAEMLERLEGRTAAVAESTLSSLVNAGAVTDREYELFIEVRAVCENCGNGYPLIDLITNGGCDCPT